jgi:2,3-bisphosphoglycerate-independent phosphoglycerate mutase
MSETKRKVILLIMDGWGLGKVPAADAIQHARVPFTDSLYQRYPNTTLTTCGEEVGLPEGQMGNSEVGHLNLGAGRVVYQELQRINKAIRDGELSENESLQASFRYSIDNNKPLHLLGLVSDGGVHAHIDHLIALVNIAYTAGVKNIFIHAFTDGRDTDPKSGKGFLTRLEQAIEGKARIATVSGRYYAMDRDKRWERVKLAYDALVQATGPSAPNALTAIEQSYARNITDEFILPTVLTDEQNQPLAKIQSGDAVICFNFRTDRCREITQVLTQFDLPEHSMQKLDLYYTTFTEYDKSYEGVQVVFATDNLNNTLGEVLEKNGRTQIRIAETEKYPHVSFFFSGGREKPFEGEHRLMIPSPKVATYDLQPQMSAREVTAAILPEIEKGTTDFICLNYANADMVGHTGVWQAAIEAVETVDDCVAQVVTAGLKNDYTIFLTADHGNADYMINPDGTPNTAHTLNPVPLFIIDKEWHGTIDAGKLGDIAPTILHMMNIPVPPEMTGNILIDHE